jgi:class 3 adenylate cyclase
MCQGDVQALASSAHATSKRGSCAILGCIEGAVMAEHRKLAAILAADVVGYSKLAGSDEERTLARLRALRSDLIDPTIAVHHGRVVKRTGDGSIIEFRSVVDAVRCAIEVQNGMVERNAGLPPERRIEFRVGIHLGDVVEESDGDLMGDGVNIAARLESIRPPNGICLSEDAYLWVSLKTIAGSHVERPESVPLGVGQTIAHWLEARCNAEFQFHLCRLGVKFGRGAPSAKMVA